MRLCSVLIRIIQATLSQAVRASLLTHGPRLQPQLKTAAPEAETFILPDDFLPAELPRLKKFTYICIRVLE